MAADIQEQKYEFAAIADQFVKDVKTLNKRDDFFKKLKEYEDQFYKQNQQAVLKQLPPELQKNKLETKKQNNLEFLTITPTINPEFLKNQQKMQDFVKANSNPIKIEQDSAFNDHHFSEQNYNDVYANSKHYYPAFLNLGMSNNIRQTQQIPNVQNQVIMENKPAPFHNPEHQHIYPRHLIPGKSRNLPKVIKDEEDVFELQEATKQIGGLNGPHQIMTPSLQNFELRQFNQKPPYDFLFLNQNEDLKQQPQQVFDPFNKNPNYRHLNYYKAEQSPYMPIIEDNSKNTKHEYFMEQVVQPIQQSQGKRKEVEEKVNSFLQRK